MYASLILLLLPTGIHGSALTACTEYVHISEIVADGETGPHPKRGAPSGLIIRLPAHSVA